MDRAQAGRVATSSSDVGFGFRSLLSSLAPGSPLGPAPFMTSLTPAPWGKGEWKIFACVADSCSAGACHHRHMRGVLPVSPVHETAMKVGPAAPRRPGGCSGQ